ncbi:MAG: UDP-glucose 4-epimerase [Candidatus Sumerlaeota bacterium]|nr:UDP-glucose 4-epimerase [Candidatus Sumerlaeota bacterium]
MTLELEGRRVLVTGAGGFIASHLTEELARRGAVVRAFTHYNARASRGWLDGIEPELAERIEFAPGDITDARSVREAVEGCEYVWHLAALIGIPYSYAAPISYVRTNIDGTLNVLEAARDCGVRRLIHTSTSEAYGTALSVPISEDHPLQAQSPYSATKIAADKLAESYWCSFGVPVVIARPFNTFGPRQSARAVIPTITAQLLAGRGRLELGALSPTRDLNYVANTVDGMIACASAPNDALGTVFNLGSGREISIADLAALLVKMTGADAEIVSVDERLRPEASEVERLVCDASRARRLLNWEPRISLEEGLERTIEWLRANMSFYRPEDYTL